ncbi:MAG TPA: hypothetical protein VHP33_19960 [Polyangiaceae bacterium]|nr:hypothetical protein [Polyangiaceae bacterium]
MTTAGIFKVMAAALAWSALSCGETEHNDAPTLPVQSRSGSGGQAATAGSGATLGGEAAAGAGAAGGAGSSAGSGGSAASPSLIDVPVEQIVKSSGCGKPFFGQSTPAVQTIQTMGTKDPDCAARIGGSPLCGPWTATREYYVFMPQNYDPEKPYPLVLQAPGCGGNGYSVPSLNNNVDNSVIRVGITPGPNSLGHGTNPDQGCFDDHEGDDSIDWVLYEQLYDKLDAELCFDRHRVFAGGYGSGGWLANELGCKYAGDPQRPIRGVFPNYGALPTDPRYVPTCSKAPLAGFWIHEATSQVNPFENAQVPIERAMAVDHCDAGTSYDSAPSEDFPIGGGQNPGLCKRLSDCDPLYPLVVCALPNVTRSSNENIVNPGWSTFLELFESPPLVAPQ